MGALMLLCGFTRLEQRGTVDDSEQTGIKSEQ